VQRTCATKATNQLENNNDSLDTPLNETEEPQIISFHQPMKLSELAQSYQPARFVATIRQQQELIKELTDQKESLESSFQHQQQIIKELQNQKELLMSSLHNQQQINAMMKNEFETVSQSQAYLCR